MHSILQRSVAKRLMLRSSLAGFSSLEGKVAIVTSACHDSDDVGWNIAHQLVLRGARV
jgi:hypothetical protein